MGILFDEIDKYFADLAPTSDIDYLEFMHTVEDQVREVVSGNNIAGEWDLAAIHDPESNRFFFYVSCERSDNPPQRRYVVKISD